MISNENKQHEMDFLEYDVSMLNKLKKEFRLSLIYDLTICLIVSLFITYLLRQYGDPPLFVTSFLNEWAILFCGSIILWCLQNFRLLKYIHRYKDIKDQKVTILESKIKEITHFKNHFFILIDHPSYRRISFRVMKNVSYENPKVNDFINLVFLPKTKTVLNLKIKVHTPE